jgi:hypothetical protein
VRGCTWHRLEFGPHGTGKLGCEGSFLEAIGGAPESGGLGG